jgi:hypothetical protein
MNFGTIQFFRSVARRCGLGSALHNRDEPVTPSWLCLNITRFLGVVVESTAQFLDSAVQTSFEIDKDIARPEALSEFFTGHYFAGMVQEQEQNFERLTGQFYLNTMLGQFRITAIHLVGTKTQQQMRSGVLFNLFRFLWHKDFLIAVREKHVLDPS